MNEYELKNLTGSDIDAMTPQQVENALRDTRKLLVDRYQSQKKDLGFTAPIYKSKKNNPYQMKITGLTEKRAKASLEHYIDLLSAKTTTTAGYTEWFRKQDAIYKIGEFDKKKLDKIWELSDRIDQAHPSMRNVLTYTTIMETIIDMVENKNYVSFPMVEKALNKLLLAGDEAQQYYAENEDWSWSM